MMALGHSVLHNPDFRYRTTACKPGCDLPHTAKYEDLHVSAERRGQELSTTHPGDVIDIVQQVGVVLGAPIRWRMVEDGEWQVVAVKNTNMKDVLAGEHG